MSPSLSGQQFWWKMKDFSKVPFFLISWFFSTETLVSLKHIETPPLFLGRLCLRPRNLNRNTFHQTALPPDISPLLPPFDYLNAAILRRFFPPRA